MHETEEKDSINPLIWHPWDQTRTRIQNTLDYQTVSKFCGQLSENVRLRAIYISSQQNQKM